jgi:type II secretion system protein J
VILPPKRLQHGFTLIEILVALAILSVVLFTIGAALFSTLELRDDIEESTRPDKLASRCFSLLSSDIKAIYAYSTQDLPLLETKYSSGSSSRFDSIQFIGTGPTRIPEGDIVAPVCEIGYEIFKRDGKRVLFRREDFYIDDNPLSGGRRIRLVEDVTMFKLEYLERSETGKVQWFNQWDPVQKEDFPAAVRAQLHFKAPARNEEGFRIVKYQTLIPIPSRPRVQEDESEENTDQ